MTLRIQPFRFGDGKVFLRLEGALVLGEDSTGALREILNAYIADEERVIVLSMAGVRKIDCAGVGLLTSAFALGRARGAEVKLRFLSPQAHHVLTVFGLVTVFGLESVKKAA